MPQAPPPMPTLTVSSSSPPSQLPSCPTTASDLRPRKLSSIDDGNVLRNSTLGGQELEERQPISDATEDERTEEVRTGSKRASDVVGNGEENRSQENSTTNDGGMDFPQIAARAPLFLRRLHVSDRTVLQPPGPNSGPKPRAPSHLQSNQHEPPPPSPVSYPSPARDPFNSCNVRQARTHQSTSPQSPPPSDSNSKRSNYFPATSSARR
jgi:hypothetical protein